MSHNNDTLMYHNSRCSKSRKTLQLLEDRGETPIVVEYLKDPPSEQRLKQLVKLLGYDILRTAEPEYQQSGLSQDSTHDEIVAAITRYPKLLQRPIVVKNEKAIIGRPPENVLEIL